MGILDFGNIYEYIYSSEGLEKKIENLDLSKTVYLLRDLLEIYKLKTWYDTIDTQFTRIYEVFRRQQEKLEQLKSYVGRMIGLKSADEWMNEYLESSDNLQVQVFCGMFSEYVLWTKLTEEVFKSFLWNKDSTLSILLKNKKVVDKFSSLIKDNLINDEDNLFFNVSMIINLTEEKKNLHFPEGFVGSDCFQVMVNKLIDQLDNMDIRNVIFIQQLLDFHKSGFSLNEETRIKLHQIVSEFWTSKKYQGISSKKSWLVLISKSQVEPIVIELNGGNTHLKISESWLDSINENEFLLTVIYTFVVDQSVRPVSISRPIKSDDATTRIYEMIIGKNFKGRRIYRDDLPMMIYDNQLNDIVELIISYLRQKNSSVEKLIANYFNQQILENHGITGFSMIEVDPNLPTSIKIKLLVIELESMLKQFKLLVNYNKIDLNNLEYMDMLDVDSIPSFIPNKYLQVEEGKKIKDIDFAKLFFTYNYWCGYLLNPEYRSELDLTSFKEYSLLFSDEEAQFISYCLNNKKYDNALAIRNKYLHGSTINFTEGQHQKNYIVLIKVFLIVIAKLEEEFVWKGETQNESNER